MTILDTEKIFDAVQREALLDLSFGPHRHQKTCERLREGRLAADGLSFVARAADRVVGTLRMWHVAAGDAPMLMLGPLAIDPLCRGEGLGGDMVRLAMARATEYGHRAVFPVGDAGYYNRFGFRRELASGLVLPGPVDDHRLLAAELEQGALRGVCGRVRATGAVPIRPTQETVARDLRRAA